MRLPLLRLVPLAVLAACGGHSGAVDPAHGMPIIASSGDTVGAVELEQKTGFVMLHLRAHDLPAGVHGIHLHTNGSCTPPDFKSAGTHFNPLGKQHGHRNSNGAHAGDLGNLTIERDGTGRADYTLTTIVRADLLTETGAALVIHALPDDEQTDPTGNSGERIACAVLKH